MRDTHKSTKKIRKNCFYSRIFLSKKFSFRLISTNEQNTTKIDAGGIGCNCGGRVIKRDGGKSVKRAINPLHSMLITHVNFVLYNILIQSTIICLFFRKIE